MKFTEVIDCLPMPPEYPRTAKMQATASDLFIVGFHVADQRLVYLRVDLTKRQEAVVEMQSWSCIDGVTNVCLMRTEAYTSNVPFLVDQIHVLLSSPEYLPRQFCLPVNNLPPLRLCFKISEPNSSPSRPTNLVGYTHGFNDYEPALWSIAPGSSQEAQTLAAREVACLPAEMQDLECLPHQPVYTTFRYIDYHLYMLVLRYYPNKA